ncbi:hypothetical protein CCACVL1_04276 [Corchorus capsularis]|uniref:Uncharacterized protein n=1 Tax=Corchorus capsularis TaxID=210143 RepID=A0A1R3JTY3_COCAP|nr:hypothetical protein CCACVL1_04276 [Corchorus capsularis]
MGRRSDRNQVGKRGGDGLELREAASKWS